MIVGGFKGLVRTTSAPSVKWDYSPNPISFFALIFTSIESAKSKSKPAEFVSSAYDTRQVLDVYTASRAPSQVLLAMN